MTAPLEVGARAEVRRTVTDADIRSFAEATGDTNPVHLDEAYAKGTVSAVLANRLPGPGTVYLSQTLEFKAPVRPGDTVTAEVEVLEVTGRRARLATRCRLADGTVVLTGEAVVRPPR